MTSILTCLCFRTMSDLTAEPPPRLATRPRTQPRPAVRQTPNTACRGLNTAGSTCSTHLASVAIFMEVSSHALDLEGILPISGDDGILTDAAHRGEFPRGKGTHAWELFTPLTTAISCRNWGCSSSPPRAISDPLCGRTWSVNHNRLFLPDRSGWRELCHETWPPRV